jgi:hypothetical protein
MKFREQPIQEDKNEVQDQEIREEKESTDKLKQEIIEKKKEEREKLEQYGKIGQKVRIKDRVIEGVGEIIAIETRVPFNDEIFDEWIKRGEDEKFSEGLPGSVVKVYITEGERKGQVVDHLVISEWEPVETETEETE